MILSFIFFTYMMIDVVVRGVDEIKLLCSLHEVVISDEVVVSYVTFISSKNKKISKFCITTVKAVSIVMNLPTCKISKTHSS